MVEKRLMQALRRACALDAKVDVREDIASLIISQVEPTVAKSEAKDDPRLSSPVRQLLSDAIEHRDTRISVRLKVLARLQQCVRPAKGGKGNRGMTGVVDQTCSNPPQNPRSSILG